MAKVSFPGHVREIFFALLYLTLTYILTSRMSDSYFIDAFLSWIIGSGWIGWVGFIVTIPFGIALGYLLGFLDRALSRLAKRHQLFTHRERFINEVTSIPLFALLSAAPFTIAVIFSAIHLLMA